MMYGRTTTDGRRLLGHIPPNWRDPKPRLHRRVRYSLFGAPQYAADEVITSRFPDYSSWDGSTFDADCFKSTGIDRAMLQFDGAGEASYDKLTTANIETLVGYGFPYFGHNSTQPQRMTTALVQKCLDRHIPIACFDVELDDSASPPSVKERQQQTRESIKIILDAGLTAWIYSAPWFFVPYLGNTSEFYEMGAKHHLANYGANDGTQAPISVNSIGYAWPTNVAHQYWSLANYCGRKARDMSYLFAGALEGIAMTPAEQAAFSQALKDIQDLKNIVVANGYKAERDSEGHIVLNSDGQPKATLVGDPAWQSCVASGPSVLLGYEVMQDTIARMPAGGTHHHTTGDPQT